MSKPGTAIGVNLGVAVKGSTLWGLKKSSPLVKSYIRNRSFQEARKMSEIGSQDPSREFVGLGTPRSQILAIAGSLGDRQSQADLSGSI